MSADQDFVMSQAPAESADATAAYDPITANDLVIPDTPAEEEVLSAAQQVFDTPELLEMIVELLPRWQIREVKLVQKTWKNLVKTSHRVRKAHVAHPLNPEDPYGCPEDAAEMFKTMTFEDGMEAAEAEMYELHECHYLASDWLRLNPHLRITQYIYGSAEDSGKCPLHEDDLLVRVEIPEQQLTDDKLEQYVTEPPSSCMELFTLSEPKPDGPKLGLDFPEGWALNKAWAFNKDGLKMKDLIQARDGLRAAQALYHGPDGEAACPDIVGAFYVMPADGNELNTTLMEYRRAEYPKTELDATLLKRGCGWPQYMKAPIPRFRHITDAPAPETNRKMEQELEMMVWAKEKADAWQEYYRAKGRF